ncbi:uncharacterized protein LOC128134261 [Lactuca sativa]|uniref:uncharacterized protein LOC128134261 n=1 Tax=Lactuca sativa TaxID=4236 RepID=UPI0022B0763D|nr:uncharacterized protein LOC128134261 [Lactuca sativa]
MKTTTNGFKKHNQVVEGKKKSKDSTKKKNTQWTEEEATLAKAWIAISQDGDVANAQSGHSFWNRILDHFHALLGRQTSRTYDSVNAKWHDLRATCTKFNDVFDNLKNMHRSGSNDFNILSTALHQYKITNNGKPFGNQKAWEVCRNGPKWVLYPETAHSGSTTGSNKRPRTSESEIGANLDLNDEFDATEGEGPSDVHLRRPPGSDKARKGASSSGKSTNEDLSLGSLTAGGRRRPAVVDSRRLGRTTVGKRRRFSLCKDEVTVKEVDMSGLDGL